MEIIVTGDELNELNKNCVIHIPKPMTNEEWFCTLSTEEKAEFLMHVFKNCAWCLDGSFCPFNEFPEHCPAESKENMMKWLKEKHE